MEPSLEMMLERVEDRLSLFLASEQNRWERPDRRAVYPVQAVSDLVRAGGKRLRPTFLLAGFLAGGGHWIDDRAIRAAAALELMHVSALIHDDVMDASDLRRGRLTVHADHSRRHRANRWRGEDRRYGESVAILAGDLALVYADYLMAGLGVEGQWLELRTELITGQALEVAATADGDFDPELARHIALVKSGRYTILRPLRLGVALAGREELAAALDEYGESLGEAFQLRDDLIDACGDTTSCGKPTQTDAGQRKANLVGCLTPDAVEAHIDSLVHKARAALAATPLDSGWKKQLGDLAELAAYRAA